MRARLSRTTAFRLTLSYAAALLLGAMALVGLIYWQAADYMARQGEAMVQGEMRQLLYLEAEQLPEEIDRLQQGDLRRVISYGLFDAKGRHLHGRLGQWPAGLPVDGKPHDWLTADHRHGDKVLAQRLANGEVMVVGYDARTLAHLREILIQSLAWGAGVILAGGLLVGVLLGIRPLRRVRKVQEISQRIAEGDFSQRLPVVERGDELDVLSSLVNRMVEQVGQLLDEVKSVEDNVAHDLRTPLNKLRAQLHRTLIDWDSAPDEQLKARLEKSLDSTDVLLGRFRALQRIAQIRSTARRAGMAVCAPHLLLEQLFEDYEAVAEEAGIRLQLEIKDTAPLMADRELLAEALMNLLDNALKFTPAGGRILMRLARTAQGTRIEVQDTGPGIPYSQREAVQVRFARGQHRTGAPGAGLGLAIVAAVAKTHGYQLLLEDAQPGLRAALLAPAG
ncbi:sensor histidine kinase [Pseudomonas sp. v388]|uniref:sensor histidine kinase n=1 Tax=Pseudomonas sp. v388 TaxID=2479849 RepID=UPI000F76EEB6|nr:HAMP domain-containing sensor histidine kinase [Pseudomonas sp. v388]RRV04543.1 sensor histidine kinase [Pseudomonas sp. v388]